MSIQKPASVVQPSSSREHVRDPPAGISSQFQQPSPGDGHDRMNGSSSQNGVSKAKRSWKLRRDPRSRLPLFLSRFLGWRPPGQKAPFTPFPPFFWLEYLSMKHELWLLSTVGSWVGIALIEVVMSAAFPNDGTILIVASFGASAVLTYGMVEAPVAQPRNLVGGHVFSCILAVSLTRLFRLNGNYQASLAIVPNELGHVVWLNGATTMALSMLLMHITQTVHPPGGATAIIASTTPTAIDMSWKLIYIVLISTLLMLGWACIINNIGRRKYPTHWFHPSYSFVQSPEEAKQSSGPDAEKGLSKPQ